MDESKLEQLIVSALRDDTAADDIYFELHVIDNVISICDKNDIAIIGLEGFHSRPEGQLRPDTEMIADFSSIPATAWDDFRVQCNAAARTFVRSLPQEGIVVSVVLKPRPARRA